MSQTNHQTWVCEYNGIQKAELDDINVDVAQPFNELQQRRHQLGIPAYMNTLLWGHQQVGRKANSSSAVNRSETHLYHHKCKHSFNNHFPQLFRLAGDSAQKNCGTNSVSKMTCYTQCMAQQQQQQHGSCIF